jgi:1-acyl-sn-glycerol-3-phosphate acyltransferase
MDSAQQEISYAPPKGKPLGNNAAFAIVAPVIMWLINRITKREWQGTENIPKSGAAIVCCNHISYLDPLVFAQFLYKNGRAPRFLGKANIFKVPVVGFVLRSAGQVPVERETKDAKGALVHAIAFLEAGHLLGVYPEGTLTRDEKTWPMVAKTGLARLAVITKVPVIPVAQWGAQEVMPTYGKTIKFFPRTRLQVKAGAPLDFSKWYGQEGDPKAMEQATAYAMSAITDILEELRGEKRPVEIFNPHTSLLPRIGNFKKKREKP